MSFDINEQFNLLNEHSSKKFAENLMKITKDYHWTKNRESMRKYSYW